MRIGICTGLDRAREALEAGFDYVELPAAPLGDLAFDASLYRELNVTTTNVFLPGTVRLFGPESTPYREVAERIMDRAAQQGVRLMVLGSGGARRAPDGFDGEHAFVGVAAELSACAARRGITVAPESLNRTETNVGNDLASLAEALRARDVAYTADSYHVLTEWRLDGGSGEPDASFWRDQLPFRPAHVHVATLPRVCPNPDDPLLRGFVARLRELRYDADVSLEGGLREGQTLAKAAADLRHLFLAD